MTGSGFGRATGSVLRGLSHKGRTEIYGACPIVGMHGDLRGLSHKSVPGSARGARKACCARRTRPRTAARSARLGCSARADQCQWLAARRRCRYEGGPRAHQCADRDGASLRQRGYGLGGGERPHEGREHAAVGPAARHGRSGHGLRAGPGAQAGDRGRRGHSDLVGRIRPNKFGGS